MNFLSQIFFSPISSLYEYLKNKLITMFMFNFSMEGASTSKADQYSFRPNRIIMHEFGDKTVPEKRSGHRIVTDGINVYSFGGFALNRELEGEDDAIQTADCQLYKEVWKYNIALNSWTRLETQGPMPNESASTAVILFDNVMAVYGGTGIPFGSTSSNKLQLLELNTLGWTKLAISGDVPMRMYGQSIVKHGSKLYVVGGTTGFSYCMDVHCLDFKDLHWTKCQPVQEPDGRYRHEVVWHEDKLFVFGGGTAAKSFSLNEIPVFDLNLKSWSAVTATNSPSDCPSPRFCHGCVKLEDEVFICGGYNGYTSFSDIWKFDLKSLTWTRLPCELSEPVHFHSSTITKEGQMFIFGGVNSILKSTRTNSLQSVWVKVPPLSEISWEAILHYWPKLLHNKKTSLYSLGIPMKFIERIDST